MLKKITLLVLVMVAVASARVNYFNKTVDGELLKNGQFDMIGTAEYKTAKAPFDGEDFIGEDPVYADDGSYDKATTTSIEFNLFYGLTENFNVRFGLPIIAYSQTMWDPGAGEKDDDGDAEGAYVTKKPLGVGAITIGAKYNVNSLMTSIPSHIKVSAYFDILVGMIGNDEISSGDVDYNFGTGVSYKNFVVNAGLRYNTGKFTSDASQMGANANYRLLSTYHQERLGSKNMVEGNEDEVEGLEEDGTILPVQSMITYINLGYVHTLSEKVGAFGELNLSFPMRSEVFAGLHWAPNDIRQMYLKPYVGVGLTAHSDQMIFGADLVLREGLLTKEKTDNRLNGYYYVSDAIEETKPVENTMQSTPAPIAQPQQTTTMYKVIVKTKYTNIRTLPNNTGKAITTARKGETFPMLAEVGNYYNIEIPGGKSGFVHKSAVTKVNASQVSQNSGQADRNKQLQAQKANMELAKKKQMAQQQKLAEQRKLQQQQQRELDKQKRLEAKRLKLEQKKIQDAKDREKKNAKLQKKWKNYEIDDDDDVEDAVEMVNKGVTNATYALAGALGHEEDEVRDMSFNALVALGAVSVPAVAEELKADRYFIKKQAVSVLTDIGDPSAVVSLEKGLADKSISEDCEKALRAIPGPEAHDALMRHMKKQEMAKKIADIEATERNKDKVLFQKHGLIYGQTKDNILTMGQKIAAFKKTPSTEPAAIAIYNEQYLIFTKLKAKYDGPLGEGATLKLLEGYGYDKSIMTK